MPSTPSPACPQRLRRTRQTPRRGSALVKVLIAVAGLALVGGVSYAVLGAGSESGEASTSATLDLHVVTRTSFDITTTSNGELEARNQIEIRNRLEQQATITEIIEEGRLVKKGELLCKLNDEAIRTAIDEELLRVETARAELIQAREAHDIQVSENESALRQAELKVELARLSLQQWEQGELVSKRQENELALEKAERELERLKEKYEQSKRLHEAKFLSDDEFKQDHLSYIEAQASLKKALLAKEVYEEFQVPKDQKQKTSDLEEAKAELERVRRKNESQLATKKADLENRKRQLAIREEKLAKLQEQLAACTMLAPADGLVVYATSMERGWSFGGDGPLQIGRQVYPNQLLIVLPDTSEMVASVKVHESIAGRVRPGLSATVKIEALGGATFTGRVLSIGVLAESTSRWMDPNLREYTVKIALEGTEGAGLKPSMRCESEIRLGRVEDAIAVPVQAVFNEGFVRYVYVPSGAKFVRRPVKIGRRSDRFVEILAGLEPGDRVLLRQPAAGEILARPWVDAELAAVGLKQNEQGKIEPIEDESQRRTPRGGPPTHAGASGDARSPDARPAVAEAPAQPAPVTVAVAATDAAATAPTAPETSASTENDGDSESGSGESEQRDATSSPPLPGAAAPAATAREAGR